MDGLAVLVIILTVIFFALIIGALALFFMSLAWAFTDRPGAQGAYRISLIITLFINTLILLIGGPVAWLNAMLHGDFSSGFPLGNVFLAVSAWLFVGVPLVRWWRHGRRDEGSRIPAPRIAVRSALMIAGAVVSGLLLINTAYYVPPVSHGVVLRFGAYNRTVDSGPNFKIPVIEQVIEVPVRERRMQSFGRRLNGDSIATDDSPGVIRQEQTMLTRDLEIVAIQWSVYYRVADSRHFLFNVREVEEVFRDMNETVMRRVVGERTTSDVLKHWRPDIEATVQTELQELADRHQTGIIVEGIGIFRAASPDLVEPSWAAVKEAEERRDRLIREVRGGDIQREDGR